MGHRHLFNSSQILETDNDEGPNHPEHAHVQFARAGASEGSNFVYPPRNTGMDGRNLAAIQLNHPPSSDRLLSGALISEYPQYHPQPQHQHQPQPQLQPQHPRASYDPFLHTSASGSHNMTQKNYASSSSIHGGQTFHGRTDGAVTDFPSSGTGPYKRKRHGFPGVYQRGSTSRYCDTGSSSSFSMPVDSRQEKQIVDSHQPHWDFSSSYGGHDVTFHREDTPRNVRSRSSFDLEDNSAMAHFSPNHAHSSIASVPIDHSSMSNLWAQAPNMLTREQNHSLVNPVPQGRAFVSEPGVFSPENHVIGENINHSAAMEIGGYGDYSFHQNPVHRSVQVNPPSQAVRGIQSTYHQRYAPGVRPSSSNLHSGNVVASDEGLPMISHGYSGRHSRSHPTSVHRDRGGRPRMTFDRYRALPDDVVVRNHLTPEGLVIVDRSALYGSRTLFDQHRDMRLDIDNMTYEELLALEERMGNVNTGVSEDQISKCLTESIFCSSDEPQEDEGKCAICLEEYKNMDDVGSLKLCGHDFHVQCIRKWVAVKNLCPICKSCAIDDKIKNN